MAINFNSLESLQAQIPVPVQFYYLPSQILLDTFTVHNTRFEDNFNFLQQHYGTEFTITENLLTNQTTIAEIYFILQDKKINDFITVLNHKVQIGIKRLYLLQHLNPQKIFVAVFGNQIQFPKIYKTNKKLNKTYECLVTNVGYEIRNPLWHRELRKRLQDENLYVTINSKELYINNQLLFYKDVYKQPWRIAL